MSVTEQIPEWASQDPATMDLGQLDLMNPYLFHDDYHVKIFERLRQEAPVHKQLTGDGGSQPAGSPDGGWGRGAGRVSSGTVGRLRDGRD